MPELPEVETIARRLREVLPGKRLEQIKVWHPKSFVGSEELVLGATIQSVERKAKILSLVLDNGLYVATHLKMTGQLIYTDSQQRLGGGHPTADWVQSLPSSHTRISYQLSDNARLFFNDQRLFGWMKVVSAPEHQEMFANVAPDITDPAINAEYLYDKCTKRSSAIKTVIMDNQVVAGIGNIYACDALNLARVSPFRPANSLSFAEVERLLAAAKQVINRGIELGGTTSDGKFVDIAGFAGGYQHEMLTYDREGLPCKNCGAAIKKGKLGGRGTYFCEVCQK